MLTITVLVENETRYETLACEHGLSLLLTCGGKTILFDTGESGAFLRNADAIGMDLDAVTTIVLSHGHHDHTGGLGHLLHRFAKDTRRSIDSSFQIIAHPDILLHRRKTATEKDPGKYIGVPEPTLALLQNWSLRLEKNPLQLTESLLYLGEIPRTYPEAQALLGEVLRNGWVTDTNLHKWLLANI